MYGTQFVGVGTKAECLESFESEKVFFIKFDSKVSNAIPKLFDAAGVTEMKLP